MRVLFKKLIYSCLFFSLIGLFSCNESKKTGDGWVVPSDEIDVSESILLEPFSVKQFGYILGKNFFEPSSYQLKEKGIKFQKTLQSHCENTSDEIYSDLQKDWKDLVLTYQLLAGVPFGPFTEKENEFLSKTYSYPMINSCAIDKQVVDYSINKSVPNLLRSNQRGLLALEYLLFEPSLNTSCSQKPDSLNNWVMKTSLEKSKDRCLWAHYLAVDLNQSIEHFNYKWSEKGENYKIKMLSLKNYKSDHEFLSLLMAALYRIEFIKDEKLAKPLDIHKECKGHEGCLKNRELYYSNLGLESILSNLQGLKSIYFGPGDGIDFKRPSFAKLIEEKKLSEINVKIKNQFNKIEQEINGLLLSGESWNVLLEKNKNCVSSNLAISNPLPVCQLYASISDLARVFKTEVLIGLSLRAPQQYQGDND